MKFQRLLLVSAVFVLASLPLVSAQQRRPGRPVAVPAPKPTPVPNTTPAPHRVQIFGPSQNASESAPRTTAPAATAASSVRRNRQAAKLFDAIQQADHSVIALDGQRVALNNLLRDDRPNVIIIWSTYCHVCQTGLQDWQAIYERLGSRDVNVLALSVQPAAHREQVKSFMREKGLGYPVYFASRDLYGQITEGNFGTPTTFVFAADGSLVSRLIGWTEGQGRDALALAIRRAGQH